jgi:hypothetical protein
MVNPTVQLTSLDGDEIVPDTHWVDDMSDEDKQYYVELSRPPRVKSSQNEVKGEI